MHVSGERLIVYLDIRDVSYGVFHTLDHTYMLVTLAFPPDPTCRAFGFFLNEIILAELTV